MLAYNHGKTILGGLIGHYKKQAQIVSYWMNHVNMFGKPVYFSSIYFLKIVEFVPWK